MDHASLAVGISVMLPQWKARILAGFLQVLISNFFASLGKGRLITRPWKRARSHTECSLGEVMRAVICVQVSNFETHSLT